ncbi:hypothetical protein CSAL01_11265 [Colletotrichum salicis]|uniref:Uncharacterized protein n=1 Tax=Colletotrichum salicis TaxID=1209931 RepID=A0A135UCC2_9PEZI|nr:hypothetical protein CSAL01_11265 [Colletotrichum salicis]
MGYVFSEGQHIIRTFRHLLDLVEMVKQNRNENREELGRLVVNLCQRWVSPSNNNALPAVPIEHVYNSVDFAIEVWLMRRFNAAGEIRPPGERGFAWRDERKTTADAFRSILPGYKDPKFPPPDKVFQNTFTLRDFQKFGDFIIQPTDNIFEHLLVRRHKKRETRLTLHVFFHVSTLQKLQAWKDSLDGLVASVLTRQPIKNSSVHIDLGARIYFDDPKFVNETMQTLSLLLPLNDLDSIDWFRSYRKKFQRSLPSKSKSLSGIDPRAGQMAVSSRRAANYNYWLPRLLELGKEFLNYSPRTLGQLLSDHRVVSAVVGGLALKDDKNDRESLTAACCCQDIYSVTNILTEASLAPVSASVVTLAPAQVIDPAQTLIVTIRVTTTVTMTEA